jgi:endonuclease YncB( thermonuclease family)
MAGRKEVIMKSRVTTLVLCCLGAAILLVGGALAEERILTGKCVKVVDGDTLIIECDKARRTVELDGIDAPELKQPWGKEVRSFVKNVVGGREVEIEMLESSDDIVRARVTVNGQDLSEMLVASGLAWVPEDANDDELAELSTKAKGMPCGLWRDADPIPPWDFREATS